MFVLNFGSTVSDSCVIRDAYEPVGRLVHLSRWLHSHLQIQKNVSTGLFGNDWQRESALRVRRVTWQIGPSQTGQD